MNALILVAVSIAAAALIGAAQAQTFPSKSLRIVVPFPPGGTADITSRVVAVHLAKGLGQTVVVENRPGGSTIIGTELVARSPADGHTLLVVFPSFVINPALRREMSFDPLKDFKAVGQTMSVPMAIAVHPSVPARTLEELIALAHAPFQGGAPALVAATGGHIPMIYGNATEVAPSVKSGKLRAIVVTSAERADVLPDAPTMRESGYPELEATNWSGMVVPGATPPSAIARLNAELVQALRNADTQDKFRSNGMSPAPGTPEEFNAFLQSERTRYAKVVREAGVKVD